MKILEVRDGCIKFEADKSIYLSSFIQVDGEAKSYIAQVNQIKNLGSVYMANAKILFLYINGELFNYDKTLPPTDADIKTFTKDILNNSINAKKPVIIGKTLDNTLNINIDSSAFNKKMLISVDTPDTNNILIRNFSKQFEHLEQKTIIIDTLGIIKAKKYIAGKDFKLPLNTKALNFMYESCLNDATADSKAIIVDIFNELAEYSGTVPFVPFETLKSIIYDMVDKQHVFKLLILKNKLAKFEKLGYFASSKDEVENLDKILASNCAIIDLSQLDALFQNNYLNYLYEKLSDRSNIQIFLETSNMVSKKNLKKILTESALPTTIVTHSKFIYLNDIKNLFDNFIIEPCITNNEIFSVYSSFLTSMQKNTYLTTGEAINYIPLVSETQVINDVTPYTEDSSDETIQEEMPEQAPEEFPEEMSVDISDEELNEDSEELNQEEDNDDTEIIDISDENEDEDDYDFQEKDDNEEIISNRLTNEEVLAVIDEKADNVLTAVAEALEEPENLNVFSEDNTTDINEDVLEENDIRQEEFNENNNIIGEEQNIIEPEYNEILEAEDNSFTQELENETDLEEDLAELNGGNETIGEIEDNEMLQSEEDSLEDLSTYSNEGNLQETEYSNNDDLEIQDSSLSEEMLDMEPVSEDEAEELTLNEEPEEISVDTGDMDILLEETDEQLLTDELPQTNMDVDLSEPSIMPIVGEALNHDFDEIVELDASESSDDDIIVDLNEDDEIGELDEDVEQQIMADVDKVYTTMKNDDALEEISDSDLDLIDELNNDGEELEEYTGEELEEVSDTQDGIINEIHEDTKKHDTNDSGEILEKRDSNTPIVPVYDADIPQEDMVMSDPIQQGDAVMHVKYGNGVVEKMIKYGNKTLFAINFENIGRRLLDPTLTEIKRV